MVSANAVMRAESCSDIRIRPNWSPASRASVSCGLRIRVSRRASVSRMKSPTAMPTKSLTCLKRSRSITISVGRRFGMVLAKFATAPRRSMNNLRFGRPVRLSCTLSCSMRSSAFFCSVTSVSVPTTRETSPSEPTTGRAFSANHMKWPSGVRRRKSCTSRPRRWSSTLSSAARKRSWSSGCSTSSHFAAGPSSVPRLRPSRLSVSGLVNTLSAETSQSQIRSPEPVSASARRSTSETTPVVAPPPAKACCMTVNPISITISTRPPSSAGPTMSLVTFPATAMPAATTQTTSRNQVGINSTARSKPCVER